MLTRKSLVRPARRGERPIERASCWFPPKFLLGKRPLSAPGAVRQRCGESGPRAYTQRRNGKVLGAEGLVGMDW